jgi:hypothetical protein
MLCHAKAKVCIFGKEKKIVIKSTHLPECFPAYDHARTR